jgi:hypothetical protein
MWIESHQSLLTHRKTGRLSRALGVSKITAIGHLHAFWWWCMDNAPNGDLTGIDAEDIADGACWESSPPDFLDALVYAGFVDEDENHNTSVHDWRDFAGKLIEKRTSDAKRKRESRLSQDIQRTSDGHPCDGVGTEPNRTVPDITEPCTVTESVVGVQGVGADAPVFSEGAGSDSSLKPNRQPRKREPASKPVTLSAPQQDAFERFWKAYPNRVGRPNALAAWARLQPDRALMEDMGFGLSRWKASQQWANGAIQHPATWLNSRAWEDEPAPATVPVRASPSANGIRGGRESADAVNDRLIARLVAAGQLEN